MLGFQGCGDLASDCVCVYVCVRAREREGERERERDDVGRRETEIQIRKQDKERDQQTALTYHIWPIRIRSAFIWIDREILPNRQTERNKETGRQGALTYDI